MKIAILSDIHGNSDALNAVLLEARNESVEKLFILGDMVGYYYFPEKVLHSLEEWDHLMIKGNHEVLLAKLFHKEIDPETIKKKYGSGHESAIANLSFAELERISNLPSSLKLTLDGLSISLNHGSSFNQDQYLYPDSDTGLLEKCNNGCDFVFIGHSHYPFIYRMSQGLLINVGSVGQSRVKGGVASWGILNTESKTVTMKATLYDTAQLINMAEAKDPDVVYLSNILKR